jgi:hypothetical protein
MAQVRANGIDIEYETFGRKSDPALLLIMGFSGQLTMWPVALCEGLAAHGFYVIRFDNRDVGKSTHLSHLGAPNIQETMMKVMSGQTVDVPYRLEDMAKDAVGLLDALDIERAHIVLRWAASSRRSSRRSIPNIRRAWFRSCRPPGGATCRQPSRKRWRRSPRRQQTTAAMRVSKPA